MTDFQSGVIALLRSALGIAMLTDCSGLDWEKIPALGKQHQISAMLFYGISESKLDPPAEVRDRLEKAASVNFLIDQRQQHELGCIRQAFEQNGIDYMLLKGARLKHLYPKTEMRQMGDADILIRVEQYERIKPLLTALGYTEKSESDHELIWFKQKMLLVELHKRLIPSYNKDFYAYYGDGWQLAKKQSDASFEYAMKPEDEWIYLFTHFAKHYRDGGIGIRHLTDLWLFLSAHPNMDEGYIRAQLDKLQLLRFYENIVRTARVWFDKANGDEVTDFITEVIFGSGSYGTEQAHVLADAVKTSKSTGSAQSAKKRKMRNLLFLPYASMCIKYPFLKKLPFLLPVMWVVRALTAVFQKRDNIRVQSERLKMMAPENIDRYQAALHFVGLDYNFKE